MNILLVDDEPICVSTVSHILNNMYDGDVTIYTAISASEALDIVKEKIRFALFQIMPTNVYEAFYRAIKNVLQTQDVFAFYLFSCFLSLPVVQSKELQERKRLTKK